MDVSHMSSPTPLSKIPATGMFAEQQSRIRQVKQQQEQAVQKTAQTANEQKMELDSAVAKNERINGVEASGLQTLARKQESTTEQKFMQKIDIFA